MVSGCEVHGLNAIESLVSLNSVSHLGSGVYSWSVRNSLRGGRGLNDNGKLYN